MSEVWLNYRQIATGVNDERCLSMNQFPVANTGNSLLAAHVRESVEWLHKDGSNRFLEGDQWAIGIWVKLFNNAIYTNNHIFVTDKDDATEAVDTGSLNALSITSGTDGDLTVKIIDKDDIGVKLSRTYNSFFEEAKWTHVVVTKDVNTGTFELYRNAILMTADSETANGTPKHVIAEDMRVIIGAAFDDLKNAPTKHQIMDGRIYSIAFWPVHFLVAPIVVIYNSGNGTLDLTVNSGDYDKKDSLRHWWTPGRNASDIGEDRGNAFTTLDIMDDAQNISAADIINDFPGKT